MWVDAAPLIERLQDATANGGVFVLKIDNEREDGNIFTIVVNGSKYGGKFFRKDGADLAGMLRAALEFCERPG